MLATRSEAALRLVAHYLPAIRAKLHTPSAIQLMRNGGLEPDPWQADLLTSPATRLLVNCSRQSGKTTVLGALALHSALTQPRALVLCLAPAQRQAQELYRKVLDLYDATPNLAALRNLSELRVEFANRSRILVTPADERRGVRGFSRPDLVLFDEAAGVPDDVFAAARPLFAVNHQGRFILSSTPRGRRGTFYEEWEHGSGWQRWRIPADQCPRISAEFLDGEKAALGLNWFLQEYHCQFLQPLNSMFDYAAIDSAMVPGMRPLYERPLFQMNGYT